MAVAVPNPPFFLRLSPEAVAPFLALEPREVRWLLDCLARAVDQRMSWLNSESLEAPHDLWVLHEWDEFTQTMNVVRLGHFPLAVDPRIHPIPTAQLVGQGLPRADGGAERWDNEGGR